MAERKEADTGENARTIRIVWLISYDGWCCSTAPAEGRWDVACGRTGYQVGRIKEKDQLIEVSDAEEPAASLELGLPVMDAMRKMRKDMYPASSFHNAAF